MNDRIPTPGQEGRVLITPENGSPFFATLAMADNPTQPGTPINKRTLLTDPTAALFGFGNEAVPNTIFDWIGRYNTHWWSREGAAPATYILGDENTEQRITGKGYTKSVYYSDSVSVDNYGHVSLVAPVSNFVVYGVYNSDDPDANELGNLNAIIGKYFYVSNAPDDIYFRTSTKNAYFDSGSYVSAQPVYGIPATVDGEVSYIHSTDRNAYPDSGTVDGLTYEYLDIPFANAVTAPRIQMGTYVGTGTYGSANPNSLTFDFAPKVVIIMATHPTIFLANQTEVATWSDVSAGGGYGLAFTVNENTVSWYMNKNNSWHGSGSSSSGTGGNAVEQLNTAGIIYQYLAIG